MQQKIVMPKLTPLAVLTALVVSLGSATTTIADNSVDGVSIVRDQSAAQVPEKPEAPERDATEIERPTRPEKPETPEKPDTDAKSPDIREIMADFRTKVTELQAQRQDLRKQLIEASEGQRAKIREELQASREAWSVLKEHFRDEIKELQATLKNHELRVNAEEKAEAIAAAKGGKSRE
jgi:hypothetical protein